MDTHYSVIAVRENTQTHILDMMGVVKRQLRQGCLYSIHHEAHTLPHGGCGAKLEYLTHRR
jgi:hypothetical protein